MGLIISAARFSGQGRPAGGNPLPYRALRFNGSGQTPKRRAVVEKTAANTSCWREYIRLALVGILLVTAGKTQAARPWSGGALPVWPENPLRPGALPELGPAGPDASPPGDRLSFSPQALRRQLRASGNRSRSSSELVGCETGEAPAPRVGGGLQVRAGRLLDEAGQPFFPQGVNIFWPDRLTDDQLQALSGHGVNAVRVNRPDWDHFYQRASETESRRTQAYTDDAYIAAVSALADRMARQYPGMKLILGQRAPEMFVGLNAHRLLSPEQLQSDLAFWRKAAMRFKDSPNVVFNPENELGLHGYDNDKVWRYYRQLIEAIRETGARNLILVDDNEFGQGATRAAVPVPDDFLIAMGGNLTQLDSAHNLAGDVHVYHPHSAEKLRAVLSGIRAAGLPAVIGEFGDHQSETAVPLTLQAVASGEADGVLLWGYDGVDGLDVENRNRHLDDFLARLSRWLPGGGNATTSAPPCTLLQTQPLG